MARLGLVDQTELARWADSRGAPGDLPRLIRRLILETGQGVVQLGFPGGEGIATGSWDGTVQATEATAFLPAGLSLWELSVEKSASTKAHRDYAKRLTTPDGSPTEDCTYVAVAPRRWAKRAQWACAKSSEGRWKEVRAYGIDDLETWLESAPVTHAWISELCGLHPHGLLSAEAWWTAWSGATTPPFPAAAVLAGRKKEAALLRTRLADLGQIITVQGASQDDVLAFISALALMDAELDGGALLSRMAFVDKVEAWRRLREHPVPLAIIPTTTEVINNLGAESVHHVIVPIVDGEFADISLQPIDFQEARDALATVGLNEGLSEEVGKLARLSLLAARRRIAHKPELHRPKWATANAPRLLRRALLVGRWSEHSAEDVIIVSKILGAEYDSVREDLAALISSQDPLLARFDSSIGLVSHFDAWLLLRGGLRKDDLELFQSMALAVFGEANPALELPPDDRWKASIVGKVPAYSGDLRLGLATTLALLGSHGNIVVSGSQLTGQEWASWTVRRILDAANQDERCHLWASLRDVLTLFAEASPSTFLEAVRTGLQGESPLLRRMFMDSKESNALFTDSPHSSLLWALETCSWSPTDFGQAVDLLARLAEVDPGGRLGNRPGACLASIFCLWYPQNSVDVERRLAALEGLRQRHQSIAWQLMLSMLPDVHGGTAMDISAPRFRDWKPQQVQVRVTEGEYWYQLGEVCQRLFNDAGTNPARWTSLIQKISSLPSEFRVTAFSQIKDLSDDQDLDDEARWQIWKSLCSQASRYREFPQAKWALPAGEVQQVEELGKLFEPSSPSKRFSWLFDEGMPKIAGAKRGKGEYMSMLEQLRVEAAIQIARVSDWTGIHAFAVSAKLPEAFGATLAQASITENESEILALLEDGSSADIRLASGYIAKRFRIEGWPWIEKHLHKEGLSPEQAARLLIATDDFPRAWEVAETVGEKVATIFWRNFRTYGLGPDFSYVEVVAQRLLKVGRPGGALELLSLYQRQDDDAERADLMATCLEELIRCDPKDTEIRALEHHDLEGIFSYLERSSVTTERLGRLEWAYLAIFDHGSSPPTLGRYLAQDPVFFVDIVSHVYRPRPLHEDENEEPNSEPEGEVDKAREAVARNAYRLLSGWRTLPGIREDGTVDGKLLKQWIDESRQLLRAANRLEVGELHIGKVLASSPAGPDGVWPCLEVRDLLEALQSAKVEDGLQLHNNRGVTMRGMLDGGDQELDLAAQYRKQANQFTDRWPRTAAVLRSLAENYEREARHYEADAERRRKGFES